jgi:hypothetical protein
MTLKINMAVDTDESGNVPAITGRNVNYVDATSCGDEKQAVDEAMDFMDRFEITRLKMRYGTGMVELHTGDNRDQKAEELFHASCCFDISNVKSFSADEFSFGNPNRACGVDAAAHSALRIAKRFDRKVSFMFNNVAVPAVEPKAEITQSDIRAVVDSYNKAQIPPRFHR